MDLTILSGEVLATEEGFGAEDLTAAIVGVVAGLLRGSLTGRGGIHKGPTVFCVLCTPDVYFGVIP